MLIKKDFIEFGRGKDKKPRKKRSIGRILRNSAYMAGGAAIGAAAIPLIKKQQAISTIKSARRLHSSGTKDAALGKGISNSFGGIDDTRSIERIKALGSITAKEGKEKQQVAREAIAELRKQYPKKPRKK